MGNSGRLSWESHRPQGCVTQANKSIMFKYSEVWTADFKGVDCVLAPKGTTVSRTVSYQHNVNKINVFIRKTTWDR